MEKEDLPPLPSRSYERQLIPIIMDINDSVTGKR